MSIADGGYKKHASLIKLCIEHPDAKVYIIDSMPGGTREERIKSPSWDAGSKYRVEIPAAPKYRKFKLEELAMYCAGRWTAFKSDIDAAISNGNATCPIRQIVGINGSDVQLAGLGYISSQRLLEHYVFVEPAVWNPQSRIGETTCGILE